MLFREHAPRARKSRMYPLYRRLMLETGARADAIITVSERSRADIVEQLRIPPAEAAKVHKVFNGVSDRFRIDPRGAPPRAAFGPERPAAILYVGRADPYKNLTGLLRALDRARRMCEFPLRLTIVGPRDPRYPEAPRLASELGLDPIVKWAGFLDDENLLRVYREADLLVQPSRYEGFGLPVVEAMACGVPVICGNAGSLPEVAGDAAVLVDPGDTAGIAEAIGRVLTDEALARELRARGITRSARFTWERAAAQTLDIYRTAGNAGTQG
jgi:glycosyltransferase involved in cell wall biosynthesis